MGLKEIESTLPPGFRFYPTDEELVCHYLYKKVANEHAAHGTLVEVNLHAREPWELPEAAKLTASDWYFFSFRDRKYATGSRTNRATKTGYWKATGKDREVRGSATRAVVGTRRTLVFYQGRAPNGVKSFWFMHEFRLDPPRTPPKECWVLCRVFQKSKDGGKDNTGSPSPPFAGSSQAVVLPDQQPMMDANTDYQTGSSIGFAPPQEDPLNAVICQDNSVLDQDPQEVSSSPMMMGPGSTGGEGDECDFFDYTGFEDSAANMGFPLV